MKDSQGREISIARLDMLTDDEIQQLKDDSWDDFCWKSGNQYARMVHEYCVLEQDKRIRAAEAKEVKRQAEITKMDMEFRNLQAQADSMRFWTRETIKPKKDPEPVAVTPQENEFGPSGERLSKGRLRELRTGTQ